MNMYIPPTKGNLRYMSRDAAKSVGLKVTGHLLSDQINQDTSEKAVLIECNNSEFVHYQQVL
jgi:hypothetical protein